MSYEAKEWVSDEVITADALNNMEQGIADALTEVSNPLIYKQYENSDDGSHIKIGKLYSNGRSGLLSYFGADPYADSYAEILNGYLRLSKDLKDDWKQMLQIPVGETGLLFRSNASFQSSETALRFGNISQDDRTTKTLFPCFVLDVNTEGLSYAINKMQEAITFCSKPVNAPFTATVSKMGYKTDNDTVTLRYVSDDATVTAQLGPVYGLVAPFYNGSKFKSDVALMKIDDAFLNAFSGASLFLGENYWINLSEANFKDKWIVFATSSYAVDGGSLQQISIWDNTLKYK